MDIAHNRDGIFQIQKVLFLFYPSAAVLLNSEIASEISRMKHYLVTRPSLLRFSWMTFQSGLPNSEQYQYLLCRAFPC